jgi:hypothetical protein
LHATLDGQVLVLVRAVSFAAEGGVLHAHSAAGGSVESSDNVAVYQQKAVRDM